MSRKRVFTRSVRERQEIRAELISTRAALQDAEQEIQDLLKEHARKERHWLYWDIAVLAAAIALVLVF